jgi:hypothetical protein
MYRCSEAMNLHRLACEKKGNYMEANLAKVRLKELNDEMFNRKQRETAQ